MSANDNSPSPTVFFKYDGKLNELYKIFIYNLALGIITLGIYHFWGKTRKRRYQTNSLSLLNDRFEYTGFGQELFIGFLKGLAILIVLSLPYVWAVMQMESTAKQLDQLTKQQSTQITQSTQPALNSLLLKEKSQRKSDDPIEQLPPDEQGKYLVASALSVFYLFVYIFWLPFVAVFGSLRYRASRTTWRGIRGHVKGLSAFYGLVGVFHILLSIVTLGFWIPFKDVMLYRYKMRRLHFGNQKAEFNAIYAKLFSIHLITLITGLSIGVAVVLFSIVIIFLYYPSTLPYSQLLNSFIKHPENAEPAAWIGLICLITVILAFFIIRTWYQAALLRIKYNQLRLSNIGFECKTSGWALFKQVWGNRVILLFTLGLGMPIVTQRRMQFFCKNVRIKGDLQHSAILQSTEKKDTFAEGFSSILDIDIGLF